MAGQQHQIMDTIFAMKRKMLRRDDCSLPFKPPLYLFAPLTRVADAEDDAPFANQRHDLRRKVQYARASDPDFLSDPRPYKKVCLGLGRGNSVSKISD